MNIEQATPNSGTSEFLNFSDALHHLRWGERVARRAWRGTGYLKVQYGEQGTYLNKIEPGYMGNAELTNRDILAEDWYVLGNEQ